MHDDPVTRFLEANSSATVDAANIYAADAELDAAVPGWRSHTIGERAMKDEYAKCVGAPRHVHRHPALAVPDGEVVTYELEWHESGVRHRGHHAHRPAVADPKIVRDKVWCGGRWRNPGPTAWCTR